MKTCPICGSTGEIESVFFIQWKGFGKTSVCFDCVRKKLIRKQKWYAGFGMGLIMLIITIFILVVFQRVLSDAMLWVFCTIMLIVGLLFFLYGRSSIKSISKECSEKKITDDAKVAAAALACKHLNQLQEVPEDSTLLNFQHMEKDIEQTVFIWKMAETDDKKESVIRSFLNKCSQQPIEAVGDRLYFSPLADLDEYKHLDVHNFIGCVYKTWSDSQAASNQSVVL